MTIAKPDTTNITIRLPNYVYDILDRESKRLGQSKNQYIVNAIINYIPSLKLDQRADLPQSPGCYFVFTPDKKILDAGQGDNLNQVWANNPKFPQLIQYFLDARIAYFVTDSADEAASIMAGQANNPEYNTIEIRLATLETEVAALKEKQQKESCQEPTPMLKEASQLDSSIDYPQLLEEINQRLSNYLTSSDKREDIEHLISQLGIVPLTKMISYNLPLKKVQSWPEKKFKRMPQSPLLKALGFTLRFEFDKILEIYNLDEIEYLKQISGWEPESDNFKGDWVPQTTTNSTTHHQPHPPQT